MREYAVTKCECEACEFDHALMEWTREAEGFTRLSEPLITTWRTVTGCSECMNRLGTSEDGRPWRERMVPEEKANAAKYRMQDWGAWLAYQAAEEGDDALCRSLFAQIGFADLGEEWNWDTARIAEWLYNSFKYGWRATGLMPPLEGKRRLPVDPDPALGNDPPPPMVPETALEWLAGEVAWDRCPPCERKPAECPREPEECWMQAALKSAEEAPDEATS